MPSHRMIWDLPKGEANLFHTLLQQESKFPSLSSFPAVSMNEFDLKTDLCDSL